MNRLRLLALVLLVALPASGAPPAPMSSPSVAQDFTRTFPPTAVGKVSTLCGAVCFCNGPCSGLCDGKGSGTIRVDHAPSSPFRAYDYRIIPFGAGCAGGTPVTMPAFIGVGQSLALTMSFSPTEPGMFRDFLTLSGLVINLEGSTPRLRLVSTSVNPISGAKGRIQRVPLEPSGTSLQAAIGEEITLKVVQVKSDDSDGPEVKSTMTLASQSPGLPAASSSLEGDPTLLFPGKVLLPFSEEKQTFMPIHSGSATASIDTGSGTFPVRIDVGASGYALGKANNSFDAAILSWADLHGLPPQVVKAVIHQESVFNRTAYRYEPLTIDFKQVSTVFSGKQYNLRVRPQYSPYTLATFADSVNKALPQGSLLVAQELALRQKFRATLDGRGKPLVSLLAPPPPGSDTRAIAFADPPVSMENILYTNNARNTWYTAKNPGTERAYRGYRAAHAPFTAQTVLAASYGLMQVTVPTAIQAHYVSDGVCRQPGDLFEEDTILDVGTEVLTLKFRRPPDSFARTGDLVGIWSQALVRYNGARIYAVKVLELARQYFPQP